MWDLAWYDLFTGDTWQALDGAIRLSNALDALGFPGDENTLQLALGSG